MQAGRCGRGARDMRQHPAPSISPMEQLGLLLQDENVQRAMAEIAADPEAIVRYQDDPVVMGVIHALNAQ